MNNINNIKRVKCLCIWDFQIVPLLLPHFLDINRLGSGGKAPYQGGQPDSVTYAEAASVRIQSGPPDRRQRRAGSDATGQKAT